MKRIFERTAIKILKLLNVNLLDHAHVQIGVGHNTYLSGEEHLINNILFDILKKESLLVFDVGANVGDYAKQVLERFKNCTIHCFEPVPQNFKALTSNIQASNVFCHNIGFGSEDGTLTLYMGDADTACAMATAYQDTIKNIFTFAGEINRSVNCQLTTLDNFCKENNINEIDFLKIDVEGHELKVLRGAIKTIEENKIKVIQFEFNEFNIFSKSFLWDFYEALPNYDFYRIHPQNKLYPLGEYTPVNEIFLYQNILAVNKSLKYIYAD
jgi:FkbM family methyltransferase